MPNHINVAAVGVARATRLHGKNSPEAIEARRQLAGEKIMFAVEKAVAVAPPLTDEQIDRITVLLRGGAK